MEKKEVKLQLIYRWERPEGGGEEETCERAKNDSRRTVN